ncbi:MAG: DUF5689 domain-containing protein [Ferruginibacter sp.]
MNKFLKLSFVMTLLAGIAFLSNSCKKEFDAPPGATDPNMVANTSIKGLKALHTTAGAYDVINTDVVISGVVIANDKTGNLYKQLFIQDSTGAIQISIDATSLYGTYPVGRKIFVKCKGLCISDYNNNPQLGVKALVAGLTSFEGIPGPAINNYIIGGSLNNPVTPKVVTIADLNAAGSAPNIPSNQPWQNKYLNDLIQMEGYRFLSITDTYSDTSVYKSTQNRTIGNCAGNSNNIIVRTSAYATFAGARVPQGRGNIAALYTVFGSTKQLLMRDTSDVSFTSDYDCPLPAGTLLLENFESQTTPGPLALPNWFVGAEAGSKNWEGRTFNSNKYAQMSAFSSTEASNIGWLVTKPVNLGTFATKILTFQTIAGFHNGAALKVLVSSNYTGTGNPWAAGVTWTDITSQATLSPGLTSGYPSSFTNSGNVSLNAFSGTVYIAFKYEGQDPSGTASDKTTTWQVDNITVTAN